MLDPKFLEYADTDRQIEVVQTVIKEGNVSAAARALDISRQSVQDILKAVKKRAARKGYAPEADFNNSTAPGFTTKRISTARNGDGDKVVEWHIQEPEKEQQVEQLREFCQGLAADLKPAKSIKAPKGVFRDDMRNFIVIGDAHFGMLAHKEDNHDEDFDIETATADLRAAIDYLVDHAPATEEVVLVNVGDFLHHDNTSNATPASGHVLDVCIRHPRLLRVAGATLRYCIERLAAKFPRVRVINAAGNHDPSSAIALSMFLEGLYEKNDRIIIEPTESKFYFLEYGKNLIGVTHGDRIPANRLAGVMTRLASEAWGRTQYRRWWVGHIHHKQKLALDVGCTVESFNTLAGTDAWHVASGYGGERGIELITLHRDYGEFGRIAPSLEMIRAFQEAA